MGETTAINWCDCTKSPWTVCTPLSPACANCYARTEAKRRGWSQEWGAGVPRHRFVGFRDAVLAMERKAAGGWFRQCPLCGRRAFIRHDRDGKATNKCCGADSFIARPRVFPSLCDWLDPEVPAELLADFLDVIRLTPHLDWMLLTKRPGMWTRRMCAAIEVIGKREGFPDGGVPSAVGDMVQTWVQGRPPPANVFVGATIENQQTADARMTDLFGIPAAKYFVSCEPCLGSTVFKPEDLRRLSLLICGGESGPHARPMNPDWARSLRDQCAEAGTEFNFKQWGEFDADGNRVGKKRAGRLLSSRTWDGSI